MKTTKFHGVVHLSNDTMNFGAPLELCTGSSEEHHKKPKAAGKLTQRKKETFNQQSATRSDEEQLLQLAHQEMNGRPLWKHTQGFHHDGQGAPVHGQRDAGGASYKVCFSGRTQQFYMKRDKKTKKKKKLMIEDCLVNFPGGLWKAVDAHVPTLVMHTIHQRQGQIFRGDPSFMGSVWRDWALIDWSGYEITPNEIWGFVNLRALPDNAGMSHGGLHSIRPGVCATVESTAVAAVAGDQFSSMFTRIQTEVAELDGNGLVAKLKFCLVDADAVAAPALVIPNIGGAKNELTGDPIAKEIDHTHFKDEDIDRLWDKTQELLDIKVAGYL